MSIISWTSPRPSDTILPASMVTSAPRSLLAARRSSARMRTNSPRRGGGTVRQALKAFAAAYGCAHLLRPGDPDMGDNFAGDRRRRGKSIVRERVFRHAEPEQDGERL